MLLLIIALAAASVAARMAGGFPGYVFLKALPIWLLALRARPRPGVARDWLLFAGLIFGSGGDVALALTFPGSFVIGLGLFLIGHLLYILYFWPDMRYDSARLAPAVILVLAVGVSVWITPSLGEMLLPVYAYIGVILVMSIVAAFRATPHWAMVFAGAFIFTISDSFIAIDKFVQPLPLRDLLILGTYYPAQILVTEGCLRDRE